MWNRENLIVMAHATVAALLLGMVALLANDMLPTEGVALGTAVHQPR